MVFELMNDAPQRLLKRGQARHSFKIANALALAARAWRIGKRDRHAAKRAGSGLPEVFEFGHAALAEVSLAGAGRFADRAKAGKAKLEHVVQESREPHGRLV